MSDQNAKGHSAINQLLSKIQSDPSFRQALLNDPQQAVESLGIDPRAYEEDTRGYLMCPNRSCDETCGTPEGQTCTRTYWP